MSIDKFPTRTLISALLFVTTALILPGEPQIEIHYIEEVVHLVTFVADGDTILLESGESVRYLGVDAPETNHPSRGLECFGLEATERNRELVDGKYVRLEEDQTDRDRYGRLLRYVFVDGEFVNAVLVEEGYAFSSYYPPDTKYYHELVILELDAEEEGRGLWTACR